MDPFLTSEPARSITDHYPEPESLLALLAENNREELYGFCRQWVSEGIPHAFKLNPMLYEIVRGWLANRLTIHPKEITIIGSARIGYSLTPPPKFGAAFSENSDLDLVVISEDLFLRSLEESERFSIDLKNGEISPKNEREARLWSEIAEDLLRTGTTRSFIDTWKIPFLDRYPLAKRVGNTCWLLTKKLEISCEGFKVKKASIRVYRNLSAFIAQNRINLESILPKA